MLKKYYFFGSGTVEFEDSKTVKELIQYAFEQFGYYEPAGMEIVTLFQCHHSQSNCGWFTRDTDRTCAEEIENCDELCFAYQMPGVFYFAEGGWGHHMPELGNHPIIPDPVELRIRFEDFDNTVVINGKYCFNDIIKYLKATQYITDHPMLLVNPVGIPDDPYYIGCSDALMQLNLADFLDRIEEYNDKRYPNHDRIYYEIFEIR